MYSISLCRSAWPWAASSRRSSAGKSKQFVVKVRMQFRPSRVERLRKALAVLLAALPAVAFYVILWHDAVRIPILDDYDIILGLLNAVSRTHSVWSRLMLVLISEHNGYKLVFENAMVLAQYAVFGKLTLLPLVMFGNAFALLTLVIVLAMSRVRVLNGTEWLLLVPVVWLVLQLQYASALDFASSSLQHMAVICFSLGCIYLTGLGTPWTFFGACAAFVCAVASSPNGFFAGAVACLMLAQDRRWTRVVLLAFGICVLFAGYRYHGQGVLHAAPGLPDQGPALTRINISYALSFVGASAARYTSVWPSKALGLVLCGVFALATAKRYYRSNPAVYGTMLFILINAVAVSSLRSDDGVAQSLASRYRLYSNLFLALSYLFLIETLFAVKTHSVSAKRKPYLRTLVPAAAYVFSAVFCGISDVAGAHFLEGKKQALLESYRVKWLAQTPAQVRGIQPAITNPALLRQMHDGVFEPRVPVLREAERNGVYIPPNAP